MEGRRLVRKLPDSGRQRPQPGLQALVFDAVCIADSLRPRRGRPRNAGALARAPPPPAASAAHPSCRQLTTLRLVCKRWKRVFDSSPQLTRVRWDISPDYRLGKNGAVWDTAALPRLAACRAGVVQEAYFEDAERLGRLEAVLQLTALTSLTLTAFRDDMCDFQQPGRELAQRQLGLGALPHLRRLSIDVACLLGPSCAQLSEARHLISLKVQGFLYAVSVWLQETVAAGFVRLGCVPCNNSCGLPRAMYACCSLRNLFCWLPNGLPASPLPGLPFLPAGAWRAVGGNCMPARPVKSEGRSAHLRGLHGHHQQACLGVPGRMQPADASEVG